MPTTRFYPKVSKATGYAFVADLARFLINDLAGYTGTGWTIVNAWDASASSLQTPGSPSDMDSFGAGFGWRDNSLANGDWITLRSAVGTYGTQFDLWIKVVSSTSVTFLLCPLANWAGSASSTPTLPAINIGSAIGTAVSLTVYAGTANYSIIADESMMSILVDDASVPYWIYVGELDGASINGTTVDDRPFVIFDAPTVVGLYYGHNYWNRISPVDDAYPCVTGSPARMYAQAGFVSDLDIGGLLGTWRVLPVGIYFNDTSHKHFAGWLRNVYEMTNAKGTVGTIGTLAYVYRYYNGGGGSNVVLKWDGVTAY